MLTHRDQPTTATGGTHTAPRPGAVCVLQERDKNCLGFFGELVGQSVCDQVPKNVANQDPPDTSGWFAQNCHPSQPQNREYRLWDLNPNEEHWHKKPNVLSDSNKETDVLKLCPTAPGQHLVVRFECSSQKKYHPTGQTQLVPHPESSKRQGPLAVVGDGLGWSTLPMWPTCLGPLNKPCSGQLGQLTVLHAPLWLRRWAPLFFSS